MYQSHNGPILFRNTMRIHEGHLAQFRAANERGIAFVEQHGPQLMVDLFIDEDRLLAHSYQLYADSDAIRAHWRMSDPYIQEVMRHCTVAGLEVYGTPDDAVLERLHELGSDPTHGFPVTVTPRVTGFSRLPGAPDT